MNDKTKKKIKQKIYGILRSTDDIEEQKNQVFTIFEMYFMERSEEISSLVNTINILRQKIRETK